MVPPAKLQHFKSKREKRGKVPQRATIARRRCKRDTLSLLLEKEPPRLERLLRQS
jgi:hypothetical protein